MAISVLSKLLYLLLVLHLSIGKKDDTVAQETSVRRLIQKKHSEHNVGEEDTSACDELREVAFPNGCQDGGCVFRLTWEPTDNGEMVHFRLTTKLSLGQPSSRGSWAAIGLSADNKMANSDAMICLFPHEGDQRNVTVLDGWNNADPTNTIDSDQGGIHLEHGSVADGIGHCSFTRCVIVNDSMHGFNLNHSWHVLLAVGPLKESENGATPLQHHMWIKVLKAEVDFTSNCTSGPLEGDSWRDVAIRLHGSLMTVIFVFLVPTGMLIARHSKEILGPRWIKVHMMLMIPSALTLFVAFGLALAHTSLEFHIDLHPILGIICISLATSQVIVAFFRPPPDNKLKRRIAFNWFHRCLGIMVFLIGAFLCFYGVWLLEGHNCAKPYIYGSIAVSIAFTFFISFLLEYGQWKRSDVEFEKVSWKQLDDTSEDELGVVDINDSLDLIRHKRDKAKRFRCILLTGSSTQAALFTALIVGLLFCGV